MHDVSCDLCVVLHVACIVCRVLREFSPNDSATVIINHTAKNAQFLRDWERYRSSLLCRPSFCWFKLLFFCRGTEADEGDMDAGHAIQSPSEFG